MNCLECTAMMRAAYTVRGAIGCCVDCGAGICLDHARILARAAQPVGVVRGRAACVVSCAPPVTPGQTLTGPLPGLILPLLPRIRTGRPASAAWQHSCWR